MSDVAVVPGTDPNKRLCNSCHRMVDYREILTAPNPFSSVGVVTGCPLCKDVTTFTIVCDQMGCREPYSCGTPTPAGYRMTCGKHAP